MPRIRKNKEYPLVFKTDYGVDVKAGDRCKYIGIYEISSNGKILVRVELENTMDIYNRRSERICFAHRLEGIERFICRE